MDNTPPTPPNELILAETGERPQPAERLPGEPAWDELPPTLTPAQIGKALGISDAQARTNGNRAYYGVKHERMHGRRKLTYYETRNVAAYWRSQNQPAAIAEAPRGTAIRPNDPLGSLVASLETLASESRRSETDGDTIARLVRQNEKLMERVEELERQMREAERLLREAGEQYTPVMFGLYRKRT